MSNDEGDYLSIALDFTHGDTVVPCGTMKDQAPPGVVEFIIWKAVHNNTIEMRLKRVVPWNVVVDHGEAGRWTWDPRLLEKVPS